MAIFDSSLPGYGRCKAEERKINIKNYNAKLYEKWVSTSDTLYTVQVELGFEKCVKKILGFCVKKNKLKKWVTVPASLYSPDFFPCFWPINMVDEDKLNCQFELEIPDNIKTEEDWEQFTEYVLENHQEILKIVDC